MQFEVTHFPLLCESNYCTYYFVVSIEFQLNKIKLLV